MPDLIAQGPQPDDRWRRKLEPGVPRILGRQAGGWSTPWDDRISRRHVEIELQGGELHVRALPGARNPVFYRGSKTDEFDLRPGDHFVIGQTTFTLIEERALVSLDLPLPAGERTFTIEELRRHPFREAARRLDLVYRLTDIISSSPQDQELLTRLVNLLLSGIERATAAAVVEVGSEFTVQSSELVAGPVASRSAEAPPGGSRPMVTVLHWDRRILAGTDFRPSERLIWQAIEAGQSVVYVWSSARGAAQGSAAARGEQAAAEPRAAEGAAAAGGLRADFTVSEGVDWAFCVPVAGDAASAWALYVTGSLAGDLVRGGELGPEDLRDEVKFAELIAATLGALRQARQLTARQASLSQFFSPRVLEALAAQDAERALAPREADVTVLFCDLRGFTQESERSAGDLFGLLHRVSQALGVMTHHILEHGGVVGDFHGDAAMGFWGWPLPQPDAVERASRAALAIRAAFASTAGLVDFRVGIGIASGRAVAGKIGTRDQVKVTVFGPVVNLAARLETMTRRLRASILIDPPTAAVIRATLPAEVCRVRRLALVRPVGFLAPIEVSELLPPVPASESAAEGLVLTDAHLASYEAALDAFLSRDWTLALKHLHAVPPDDVAKDFLTVFIAQHNRTPPVGWDGSIPLEAK